ncbi:hypothetical protein GCM10027403_12670 [Arthrobacter tecti]
MAARGLPYSARVLWSTSSALVASPISRRVPSDGTDNTLYYDDGGTHPGGRVA